MGGRETGTIQGDITARYVASALKAAGLQPAGRDGTYLQPYDLSSYGLFYPRAANASVGELTYFNDVPDLERFTDTAKRLDFAGVYTWVATSDALDWRVHKRLWKALNAN